LSALAVLVAYLHQGRSVGKLKFTLHRKMVGDWNFFFQKMLEMLRKNCNQGR